MKFQLFLFNRSPLNFAITTENIDIVKLLLARKEININMISILNIFFLILFQ